MPYCFRPRDSPQNAAASTGTDDAAVNDFLRNSCAESDRNRGLVKQIGRIEPDGERAETEETDRSEKHKAPENKGFQGSSAERRGFSDRCPEAVSLLQQLTQY